VSVSGRIDNGVTTVAADQLQALLLGAGECLIDNVQVISPFAGNLITNSTFESGSAGWTRKAPNRNRVSNQQKAISVPNPTTFAWWTAAITKSTACALA